MHNIGTVIRFEVVRAVKKKSFWVMSLMFPIIIAAVAGIIYFSNKATSEAQNDASKQKFSFAITDDSKLVSPALLESFGGKTISDKASGIDAVKNKKFDAYFYYPSDVSKQKVEVYANDVGLFDNSRYGSVASVLLTQSVASTTTPVVQTILSNKVGFDSVTYRDGVQYDGFKQLIAPGVFLVLFYILIATFGSQMLTSTTEEKENRVIEMILTTVQARTLIVGKILSLVFLGFLQAIIVLTPVIIGYFLLRDKLELPNFDLTGIPLDWGRIGTAALIFVLSFLLFTGLLVAIGAATPTAKEAGGFLGVVMVLIFGPLYAVSLFVSSPETTIVQVLSYFPFTAPIPLLLRNAVGNLEYWQAGIAIVILAVTTVIVMNIAVRLFRYGALEYSRRLSIKEIFSR